MAAPSLYGVFSKEITLTLGTGVTKRKTVSKTYWFVKEGPNGIVELRSLDHALQPRQAAEELTREEVLAEYLPEPQMTFKAISQPLMTGDRYREAGHHPQAVKRYEQVRRIDEDNIRATFGLGISYLAMGNIEKAQYVFQKLVSMEQAYAEEHKHLFNAFGISLRKQGLLEETLEYYNKAQSLTILDENIQFNIARAYFEMGNLDKTVEYLLQALDYNAYFQEAFDFSKYILEKELLPEEDRRADLLRRILLQAGQME